MLTNIMVIDDHKHIRELMKINLIRNGYDVYTAGDGIEAMDILEKTSIQLIIVDIMMPRMDGYEFTRDLRSAGFTIPILMVTAKETFDDKKKGFELGADDYMIKPVNMDEILLRVAALLRRSKINVDRKLVIGDITLNYDLLEIISPDGTKILPQKEFYILYKLLSYPKKIFTRQDIMDDIWGYDSESDERTVDVHIRRLREKFEGVEEFEIVTIRGLGYMAKRKE